MTLHDDAFNYLKPTDGQTQDMQEVRALFADFAHKLDDILPDGPDKTYIMRTLRTVGMWCNVTITRRPDGAPRSDSA